MLWVCKREGLGFSRSGESKGSVESGPDQGLTQMGRTRALWEWEGWGKVGRQAARPPSCERAAPLVWQGLLLRLQPVQPGWVGTGAYREGL